MAVEDVTNHPIDQLVSLKDRCAIVTGAAQGLGKAIAFRLAEAGASVLVGDLQLELAEQVAKELTDRFNTKACATRLDVTDAESVNAGIQKALGEFGRIDILVNNAGVYPNVAALDTSDELWDSVMGVNMRGTFTGSREVARQMINARHGGVIINIVSTAGFRGVAPGVSAYVASKHGVRGLTKQMAMEFAPHDIRVLGVAPTFCTTEGNSAALDELPEQVREEIAATLTSKLGRVGTPDDIARVVLFCASDLSLFMTGSTLLVDAGETI